jgi:GNAT superfamily N-acetyltransferase
MPLKPAGNTWKKDFYFGSFRNYREVNMSQSITIEDIARDPACVSAQVETGSGLSINVRPIRLGDGDLLGEYFLGLSPETIDLYGPHPFDQVTADRFCAEIDPSQVIRWIATLTEGNHERCIAYVIQQFGIPPDELTRYAAAGLVLAAESGCLIAPSVADSHQNSGIGTPMLRHILNVANRLGIQVVVLMGGVFAHNLRAVHFYEKLGFRRIAPFIAPWAKGRTSYDMLLTF